MERFRRVRDIIVTAVAIFFGGAVAVMVMVMICFGGILLVFASGVGLAFACEAVFPDSFTLQVVGLFVGLIGGFGIFGGLLTTGTYAVLSVVKWFTRDRPDREEAI